MIPQEIKVWACPVCGYWRQEKRSGVHVTTTQDDPRGKMLTHQLVEAVYVPLSEKDGAKI